ncbi:MAG: hypothetical protein J1E43_09380 [Christensenellaceae bacterium]|nr:hypothetical protein [Christensenellaceae bacterium]
MNRKEYQIGPGAASLMLIVVVLGMSVLGLLAMMNARGDNRLSMRSAEVAEETYGLSSDAERSLAVLDAVLAECASQAEDDEGWLALVKEAELPEGMTLSGRTISWSEQNEEGRRMSCAVELEEFGAEQRTRWTEHKLFTQLEDMEPQEDTWEIWF